MSSDLPSRRRSEENKDDDRLLSERRERIEDASISKFQVPSLLEASAHKRLSDQQYLKETLCSPGGSLLIYFPLINLHKLVVSVVTTRQHCSMVPAVVPVESVGSSLAQLMTTTATTTAD